MATWQSYGVLEIGAVATGGDDDNALWNRYVHWDSGLILGLLDYTWERPDDGTYANVRASRISDDDEYYQAVFGRAGSYKIQAFLRDVPNVLTNTARPIWNGVGTNNLTLPSSLTPGGSTSAEVAAVSAATPERTLSVKRDKQGLGFSMFLTPQWTAYANVTDEQRKGARPYGGTFFFNYPFPDNGGVLETIKPIDDSTINFNGGFRYAGRRLAHGLRLPGLVLSRPLHELQLTNRRSRSRRSSPVRRPRRCIRARCRWSRTTTTTTCARRSRASCR